MRRPITTVVATAALLLLAVACSDDDGAQGGGGEANDNSHEVAETPRASALSPQVGEDLATMRAATARYATDLDAALADGHFMITQNMPDQGYHFLNPNAEGFDPNQPQILMYANRGDQWELVGF